MPPRKQSKGMQGLSDETYIRAIKESVRIKETTKALYLKYIERVKKEIWSCEPDAETLKTVGGGGGGAAKLQAGAAKAAKCDNSLAYILWHPEEFVARLHSYTRTRKGRVGNETLGDHAKDAFMSAMMAMFEHNSDFVNKHFDLYKRWKELHKELRAPIDNKYKSNEPTERQRKAYVSWETITRIRDSLEEGSPERLLLHMYTDIPPLRSDFANTKIYADAASSRKEAKSDLNYIVLEDSLLVLQEYKTAKHYDVLKIPLPDTLMKQLRASLEAHPRDWLFVSTRDQRPYSEKKSPERTFNSWANHTLKKLFKKDGFSLTMLRHIYISRKDLQLESKTGLEASDVARMMGHSVEQQRKYLFLEQGLRS